MDFFFPYQKRLITDPARYVIYEKSRRIGISLAVAFKAFVRSLKSNIPTIVCSRDMETSKLFLMDVRKFAQAVNLSLQTEVIKEGDFTSERLTFPSGATISAVSSSPDVFRGKGGHVVLDEFAFHQDQEGLYRAAMSSADWNGATITIISTHNGEGTFFNEILKQAKDGKNPYKVYRTTIVDALAEGFAEKNKGEHSTLPTPEERSAAYLKNKKDLALNEKIFAQEYMCEVLGASNLITSEQYDKCIMRNYTPSRDKWNIDLDKHGSIYVAIDVGRFNDATVLYALEASEDTKQTNPKLRRIYVSVLCKIIKNMPFDAQFQLLSSYLTHPKVRKVLIENNGIGLQLAEQLEDAFKGKVHGYHSSSTSKATVIERFAGFVAQERISLPPDADLKEDILAMQRLISDSGKITYDGRSSLGHCDVFIAASLALHCAEDEQSFFEMTKV